MRTKTRNLPTTSVPAVKRVLADVGARVTAEHATIGAVGYTTLTYTTDPDPATESILVAEARAHLAAQRDLNALRIAEGADEPMRAGLRRRERGAARHVALAIHADAIAATTADVYASREATTTS